MILKTEVHGIFATNSYFYIDDETLHGFLIDPGAEAEKILRIISEKNFVIEKILLKNIVEKIFTLPDETILLSGHSELTTVANEKINFV